MRIEPNFKFSGRPSIHFFSGPARRKFLSLNPIWLRGDYAEQASFFDLFPTIFRCDHRGRRESIRYESSRHPRGTFLPKLFCFASYQATHPDGNLIWISSTIAWTKVSTPQTKTMSGSPEVMLGKLRSAQRLVFRLQGPFRCSRQGRKTRSFCRQALNWMTFG